MTKGKVVGKGMYSRQREKGRDNYRVKVEEVAKAFFVALFLLTWTSGTSMHVKSLQSSLILCYPWSIAYHTPLSRNFPGKNTGVGCHFLL